MLGADEVRAELARTGGRWRAGETSLTALTDDDRRRRLGYSPGPRDPSLEEREGLSRQRAEAARAARAALAAAPPARGAASPPPPPGFDWRNVNGVDWVTDVEDQSSCGSCVAFGSVAAFETHIRIAHGNANLAVDESEADLFFCWGPAHGAGACPAGGWWPDAAYSGLVQGIVDAACFPYTPANQPCNQCADAASRLTRITGWTTFTDHAQMKQYLAATGPLSTCFTVYEDFYSYAGGIYHHVTGGSVGGHCVCVVGYDDANGCWICKNSWGAGWGEQGFFRIAYGDSGIDGEMWGADGVVGTSLQSPVTTTDGGLHHTIRNPDGSWQQFGDVKGQAGDPGSCSATTMAAVGPDAQLAVTTQDGGLHHTIRHADGSWDQFGDVKGQAGDPGACVTCACAGIHGELHLVTTTDDGGVHHTIRYADGSWQQFGDVKGQAGDPGHCDSCACAEVNGELQVAVTTSDGGIHHTIRHADGTWQQFGDVTGPAGNPGPCGSCSCAGVLGELQLAVTTEDGGVHHTIRHADGSWQQFGDVKGQAGDPGSCGACGSAGVGGELQLEVTTADGGLFHTIRHADGSWQQFGDVKGQAGDPGVCSRAGAAATF